MTEPLTATQCRMARSALRWSVDDLVAASGVGRATIIRFENDADIKASTAGKLQEAFEADGIRFEPGGVFYPGEAK